jgi:hypothetical protein
MEGNSSRHTELSFSRGRNYSHGDRRLCICATPTIAKPIAWKLSGLFMCDEFDSPRAYFPILTKRQRNVHLGCESLVRGSPWEPATPSVASGPPYRPLLSACLQDYPERFSIHQGGKTAPDFEKPVSVLRRTYSSVDQDRCAAFRSRRGENLLHAERRR